MVLNEAAADWVSTHLFYQGDLDLLLTHGVDPLLTELTDTGLVSDAFFLRYWDGGTHLRLRMKPADPASEPAVRALVEHRCARFFSDHPAAQTLSAAQYAALADALVELEGVSAPIPLQRNHSVVFLPYVPEHRHFGTGPARPAVEQHFVESSRLAMALVRRGLPPRTRATIAYHLVLLGWLSADPDPHQLAERLRASPPAEPPRWLDLRPSELDSKYRNARSHYLDAVATAGRIVVEPAAGADGVLDTWARSLLTLRGSLTAHRAPNVFEVLDACAHLACNRLGVSFREELRLRHLAGRAVLDHSREEQP